MSPVRAGLVVCLVLGVLAMPSPASASTRSLATAKAPIAQLERQAAVPSPGGTILRYRQETGGIEVLGAEAVAIRPAGSNPIVVADSTVARLPPPAAPRFSRDAAIRAALEDSGSRRLDGRPAARLAIAPGQGDALVWAVTVPSLRPLADYEVLVDAISGDVLARHDRLKLYRRGRASVYVPNPVVANGGDAGLKDRRDADSRLLTSLRTHVTLKHLREHQHCLNGKWALAVLGPGRRTVCRRSLDWRSATRSQKRFEALEAYFAVDAAQTYIHRLGFSDKAGNGINDRRQRLLVNATTLDNSFYRPSDRTITFGTGGVDDAEDADVIWHEYAHAIQDDQVSGFGTTPQAGAIGEGFGDYWSAAMTDRIAATTTTDAVCIFDWDSLTWGKYRTGLGRKCGRRVDDDRTLKQAKRSRRCREDIHCMGQIWSSALWDLRNELGDDAEGDNVLDRVVLQSQFLLTKRARFADAANALLQADMLLYGGADQAQIETEMDDRGFL